MVVVRTIWQYRPESPIPPFLMTRENSRAVKLLKIIEINRRSLHAFVFIYETFEVAVIRFRGCENFVVAAPEKMVNKIEVFIENNTLFIRSRRSLVTRIFEKIVKFFGF